MWQPNLYVHTTMLGLLIFHMQSLGLTTDIPNDVPDYVYGPHVGLHEWHYDRGSTFHNRLPCSQDLPYLPDLTPGQLVGVMVTANGQLHLFCDGEHFREIATGLPTDTPLWGVADVYGRCPRIKSEIMSGKSNGVFLSPSQCVGKKLRFRDSYT